MFGANTVLRVSEQKVSKDDQLLLQKFSIRPRSSCALNQYILESTEIYKSED